MAGDGVGRAGRPPIILGHRGASAEAPENTLAAFRLAVEQGADGVELDVWRCGSGEVVVHHDPDTARTGGVARLVSSTPWAELRRLDVGSWKGERFAGERIPLLAEVLDALPTAVVNVELKSSGWPDLALARAVAEILRGAWASLPREHIEAGLSFGFCGLRLYRRIILPPVVMACVPVMGNQMIQIIKDSAFLTIIAVPELTHEASAIQSMYYVPFAAFVSAVALYWLLCRSVELVVAMIERRAEERR